jgi:hypothetical protein
MMKAKIQMVELIVIQEMTALMKAEKQRQEHLRQTAAPEKSLKEKMWYRRYCGPLMGRLHISRILSVILLGLMTTTDDGLDL